MGQKHILTHLELELLMTGSHVGLVIKNTQNWLIKIIELESSCLRS